MQEWKGRHQAYNLSDHNAPSTSQWPPLVGKANTQAMGPNRGGTQPFFSVNQNFLGGTINESGFVPPDSQGAVGPTQFLMCVNGRIKVFDKTGVLGGLNMGSDT